MLQALTTMNPKVEPGESSGAVPPTCAALPVRDPSKSWKMALSGPVDLVHISHFYIYICRLDSDYEKLWKY